MPGLKACIEMMYFDSVCQISTLAKPGVSPLDKAMAKMTRKPQHVANVRPDVPYILFFCLIFATVTYHRTKAWHLIP